MEYLPNKVLKIKPDTPVSAPSLLGAQVSPGNSHLLFISYLAVIISIYSNCIPLKGWFLYGLSTAGPAGAFLPHTQNSWTLLNRVMVLQIRFLSITFSAETGKILRYNLPVCYDFVLRYLHWQHLMRGFLLFFWCTRQVEIKYPTIIPARMYTAWPKISHTLIFHRTAFSFDYSTHLPWYHFDKLMQCHIISVQSCINFSPRTFTDDGKVRPLRKVFFSTSQRFSMGLGSGLDHIWKWCHMVPEPLFHNFSPMNRGTVILDYACATRGEKVIWVR